MPKVLITPEALRGASGPHTDLLQEAGFEVLFPTDPHLARGAGGPAGTIRELTGVDAVMASGEPYNDEVLEALPRLRVVARCGVGYDAVHVPALTKHRVPLTITPTANHEAVAEMALTLILAVTRHILPNDRDVRQGLWPRRLPRPLRGQTLGLVGLGRIGRSTAIRARALGMQLLAYELYPDDAFVRDHEIQLVGLDQLLQTSDVVSLHCPLNQETHGMFNAQLFSKMKLGSVFINTARGKLVVEEDLCAALAAGHLGGAGLDVFEPEPPRPDNPLFGMDNVVLAPHVGGTDEKSMIDMAVEACRCIVTLYRGDWPDGAVVNDEIRTNWTWQR